MSVDSRAVAMQGLGFSVLLIAAQGLQPAGPVAPPAMPTGGLVYSPLSNPLRSPLRNVVRW